jgi:hypothetical protein
MVMASLGMCRGDFGLWHVLRVRTVPMKREGGLCPKMGGQRLVRIKRPPAENEKDQSHMFGALACLFCGLGGLEAWLAA